MFAVFARVACVLIGTFAFAYSPMAHAYSSVQCRVVAIADGDSFTCLHQKQQIKVRMNQIDTPEKKQAFGQAAKKHLSQMIYQKNVTLHIHESDKYQRQVADVFVGGVDVNRKMVEHGYAWAYREYLHDQSLLDVENTARQQRLGLWSQPNAIYPSEFRHAAKGTQTTQSVQAQPKRIQKKSGQLSCSGKRFCKEMASCAEAKFYLNQCGIVQLDRDQDGVPCESLCR
ncbi:MAG: thermonuclease family protein [Acinetobacter sp.]|nr:thermonuclease family protein [Acinetobacter sp.]